LPKYANFKAILTFGTFEKSMEFLFFGLLEGGQILDLFEQMKSIS
jgi:hypothetical protein